MLNDLGSMTAPICKAYSPHFISQFCGREHNTLTLALYENRTSRQMLPHYVSFTKCPPKQEGVVRRDSI